MTDTDLDQSVHEQLVALVAQAPLPPTVDEITGRARRTPGRGHGVLAVAAAFVLLAVGAAVVLRVQGDADDPPTASGPVRTEPDLVVVMNLDPTDAQVSHVDDLLDDPLVTESVFVESIEAYDEVASTMLLGPQLDGIEQEAIHASFRADVVDHDLDRAQSLVGSLRTAPGVWAVHLDPEPAMIPSLLFPPGDSPEPTQNIVPLDPGEDCPELYLPGDDDGDGVADTCMRVRDGGG